MDYKVNDKVMLGFIPFTPNIPLEIGIEFCGKVVTISKEYNKYFRIIEDGEMFLWRKEYIREKIDK